MLSRCDRVDHVNRRVASFISRDNLSRVSLFSNCHAGQACVSQWNRALVLAELPINTHILWYNRVNPIDTYSFEVVPLLLRHCFDIIGATSRE